MVRKNNQNLQNNEEAIFSLAIDCSQLNKINLALTNIISKEKRFESIETSKISASIMKAIQQVLAVSSISLEQIGRIIIARGPGSFTGIRNCFSTVLGLGFGLNIEVFSIANLMIESYALKEKQCFKILKVANDKEYYQQEFQYLGSVLSKFSEAGIVNISSIQTSDNVILSDSIIAKKGLLMVDEFFKENSNCFRKVYTDTNDIGDLSIDYIKAVNAKTLVERGKISHF